MTELRRWGKLNLLWHLDPACRFGALAYADAWAACCWAWGVWGEVIAVKASPTIEPAAADVRIVTQEIDGPWGTLAISEMPPEDGSVCPLHVRCDAAENWVRKADPEPWEVDLDRILLHEFGHAIGIPQVYEDCAMNCKLPYLRRHLTAFDRAAAQALYPPAGAAPPSGACHSPGLLR